MKVLMIVSQPFFSFRGTSFSVYYRALMMARQGVEIDLLTYGEGEDIAIPGVNIIRIPRFSFLGPVKIGPSYKKAFLNIFIMVWTLYLLIRKRYDCIHAHEEAVFYSVYLKRIFGFKLIYDMHSSLPQQLTNFAFTRSRFLIGLFERMERKSLKDADAVITICPELENLALSMVRDPRAHALIENSLCESIQFTSYCPNEVPITIPEDKKLIVYAGTFEAYQGIDLLIEAFQLVLDRRKDVFLLLMGGTPEQVKTYQKMGREYLGVYPRTPQSQVRKILSKATLQVSPRTQGSNTPLKVYEQLSNGIPLVATDVLSHQQVLSNEVCFFVKPDFESLAEGIVEALDNPKACSEKIHNAQNLYERNYGPKVYEKKIGSLIAAMGA